MVTKNNLAQSLERVASLLENQFKVTFFNPLHIFGQCNTTELLNFTVTWKIMITDESRKHFIF